MFCSNCGKEVADGAKFCSNCGTLISGIIKKETTSTDLVDCTRNLLLIYKELVNIEEWQHIIDLCEIYVYNSSLSSVGTLFKKTLFTGGAALVEMVVDSNKATKELKEKYGIYDALHVSTYKKKIDEYDKKIKDAIDNKRDLLETIPTRYLNTKCIEYLIGLFNEKRVNNLNEALDKLDTQVHNWIVEGSLCDINSTLSYWQKYGMLII